MLRTVNVIYTCGHVQTATIKTSEWRNCNGGLFYLADTPHVRDTVLCSACRDGLTPAWDRTERGRMMERARRAELGRKIATEKGLVQPLIDRAASYASDFGRFDSVEEAVEAASRVD